MLKKKEMGLVTLKIKPKWNSSNKAKAVIKMGGVQVKMLAEKLLFKIYKIPIFCFNKVTNYLYFITLHFFMLPNNSKDSRKL